MSNRDRRQDSGKRKMTTSDGRSKNTRPKNKNKRKKYKKYRGQGKK